MTTLSPKEILALRGRELDAEIDRMLGRDPWAAAASSPGRRVLEVVGFMLSKGFSFTLTVAPSPMPMFRAAFQRSQPYESDADSTYPADAVCWAALLAWSEEGEGTSGSPAQLPHPKGE